MPEGMMKIKKLAPFTLALVICGTIIILVIISGILYPKHLRIKKLKNTRVEKMIVLENQKALFPVFAQADKIARTSFNTQLPTPDRTTLKRHQITSLTKTFKQMAIRHQLILSGNSLDISLLNQETDHMTIELSLKGELFNFRGYLISLAELEFFNSIDGIKIFADKGKTKRFITKIRINIDQK